MSDKTLNSDKLEVIENGVYGQLLSYGGYLGYNSNINSVSIGVIDQISAGVAVYASYGIQISLDDLYDLEFNIETSYNFGFGAAVPTGVPSPVTGGVFYNYVDGTVTEQVGVGLTDLWEGGIYSVQEVSDIDLSGSQYSPIGTVSSARLPGQYGTVELGYETNALDVQSELNALNGTYSEFMDMAEESSALSQQSIDENESSSAYNGSGNYNSEDYYDGGDFDGGDSGSSGSSGGSGGFEGDIGGGGFDSYAPVVLDLDNDGVELLSPEGSSASYDVDADGYTEQTGWVSPDDGILAYDKDGDGIISETDEIVFTGYKEAATTDLEGLTAFDSNGDGQLDTSDESWGQFGVWQDKDQDSKADAGEFISLDEAGISSISLTSDNVVREQDGNIVNGTGSYTRSDGTTGLLGDVALRYIDAATAEVPTNITDPRSAVLEASNHTLDVDIESEGILGTNSDDNLTADGGSSVFIHGGDGDDQITGSSGHDVLIGGAGADSYSAGAGNDIFGIDSADTVIDGGAGVDAVYVLDDQGVTSDVGDANIEIAVGGDGDDTFSSSAAKAVTLNGMAGNDSLSGGLGDDLLLGSQGGDNLTGNDGNDVLVGGDGVDRLYGGDGDDVLRGGSGNDYLYGGADADADTDTFLFDRGDGFDRIGVAEGFDRPAARQKTGLQDVVLKLSTQCAPVKHGRSPGPPPF